MRGEQAWRYVPADNRLEASYVRGPGRRLDERLPGAPCSKTRRYWYLTSAEHGSKPRGNPSSSPSASCVDFHPRREQDPERDRPPSHAHYRSSLDPMLRPGHREPMERSCDAGRD